MIRFKMVRGKLRYQWFVWPGWCRIGLHFMELDFLRDMYRCPCGFNYLKQEDIRA